MSEYSRPRYLISMENSKFLCYETDCHCPLSGVSWLHVPEQVELGRELTPLLPFNSETPQCLSLTQSHQFLSSGKVPLPHSERREGAVVPNLLNDPIGGGTPQYLPQCSGYPNERHLHTAFLWLGHFLTPMWLISPLQYSQATIY